MSTVPSSIHSPSPNPPFIVHRFVRCFVVRCRFVLPLQYIYTTYNTTLHYTALSNIPVPDDTFSSSSISHLPLILTISLLLVPPFSFHPPPASHWRRLSQRPLPVSCFFPPEAIRCFLALDDGPPGSYPPARPLRRHSRCYDLRRAWSLRYQGHCRSH